jgi:multiple sugar transport system ATP-binding protein
MVFESKTPLGDLAGGENNAVLGVRPEFLRLKSGAHKAKVYATLPAGMETTVKLKAPDGTTLTSVEFGSVDYDLNSEVSYEIAGDGIILFDKKSEKNIGKGCVKV